MTNDEVLALYLAARLLSRHSDQAATAVRTRRTRRDYQEALEVLTQGWAEGRKVRLRYRSSENEITERTFAPYFIEPSGIGYACYVIGHDDLRGTQRTLKVERIAQTELTDERFSIPPDFDPQRLLADAWGVIWRDEGAIEVTLRFAPTVVWRIKESTWHHSQRIEDLPDGSCLFTVRVGSTLELKPWIRQWGSAVTVLAPPRLREEIVAEVREMARNYGRDD